MNDNSDDALQDERLEIFSGALNPAVGRVYARWGRVEQDGVTLRGTLTGPDCEYATTLPATARFVDRGPDGPPLAEAIVPEPSFWTPEMPHVYQADVELQHDGKTLARATRTVGLRPLGVAGNRLRLDGKNWVLRGVAMDEPAPVELGAWHETNTVLVVRCPSNAICEAASRVGVLILAELDDADMLVIRRLSRWPAVGIVALPAGASVDPKAVAHNMQLAERMDNNGGRQPSAWADLVICEIREREAWNPPPTELPVVASRRQQIATIRDGRAACDRLQAELSAQGLLAGYIC